MPVPDELKDKRIVLITPELKTFKVRAGGLGPAVEELAKALAEAGLNVTVISTLYKYYILDGYKKEVDYSDLELKDEGTIPVEVSGKVYPAKIYTKEKYGAKFVFLFNPELNYAIYYGDLLKYSIFLGKGSLLALSKLGIKPDIIHMNDAQTALVSAYAKNDPYFIRDYLKVKYAYTIHNAGFAYQQIFSQNRLNELNLPSINWSKFVWNNNLNLMFTGISHSDIINTVSKDYAVSLRAYGEGMKEIFNQRNVFGILNGIDVDYWRDDAYKNTKNLKKVKAKKKQELIDEIKERTGKELDAEKMIVVMPRRLSGQKGFDRIHPIIPDAYNKLKVQFIVLGVSHPNDALGKQWAEEFRKLQEKVKGFAFVYAFDEPLAKLMYAGGDLLMYPSLPNKEPCGTGYMMSMVNATPALGTRTGGLAEVIQDFDDVLGKGNGFLVWKEEYSSEAFYRKLSIASNIFYNNKEMWRVLMKNAFNTDVRIENAAQEYILKVYLPVIRR